MTRRNLRLPDDVAGNNAKSSMHTEQQAAVTKPERNACTNPSTSVAGNQDAEPRPATEIRKPIRKRKQVQALGRNRASPARIFKLNALLSSKQKTNKRVGMGWHVTGEGNGNAARPQHVGSQLFRPDEE